MRATFFKYRCRLCGEVFIKQGTVFDNAFIILLHVIDGKPMPEKFIGSEPHLIEIHPVCKHRERSIGVADLIGIEEE